MEKEIVLSICIPTYNRYEYLKKQVEFFMKEIDRTEGSIEFIISNNYSSDKTKDYLGSLPKKKYLRINTNNSNVGAANNFLKCIDLSNGKFIWIVGDDDTLYMGVLKRIMSTLSQYPNIKWLFLNFDKVRNNSDEGKTHKKDYGYCEDGIELLDEIVKQDPLSIMFISANILNKESVNKVINSFEKGIDAIPMAYSIQCAIDGAATMIEDSYIKSNIDNISWFEKSREIYVEEIPMIVKYYKNFLPLSIYAPMVDKICGLYLALVYFYNDLFKKHKIIINERIKINYDIHPVVTVIDFIFIPIKVLIKKIKRRIT